MSQDLNPNSLHVHLWSCSCTGHAKTTLSMQCQPRSCNNIPSFLQRTAPIACFFVKVVPGTTFTSWSKHHFVVIGKAEQQVRKAFHCRTKKQKRSHVVLILSLLVRTTWFLFFTHITFVVDRTFTTALTERLQTSVANPSYNGYTKSNPKIYQICTKFVSITKTYNWMLLFQRLFIVSRKWWTITLRTAIIEMLQPRSVSTFLV